MHRRAFISGLGSGLLGSFVAHADDRQHRIGFLGAASQSGYAPLVRSLLVALAELGWTEGQNLKVEYRWAEGRYERVVSLARDLVATKPELIVTHGTPAVLALQKETTDIPIIFIVTADAATSHLVESFARPGGNTTGQSFLAPEMSAKRLELFKEAMPTLARMATVFNAANPVAKMDLDALGRTATAHGIEFRSFQLRGPADFDSTFDAIVREGCQGVQIIHDAVLTSNVGRLAELTLRHKLPSIGEGPFVKAGGLIGYGPDFNELWRSGATYIDRVLKGARPADLPVQLPIKFEFLLNIKTARALGLELPPTLLARADEIIE